MNPLLKKEIRLLLPAWLAVLVLEVALPWFASDPDTALAIAPVFFFFGMILLAVDSFGREFSLGTFSSLMAQPVARRQIWRTKIATLFFAAALIFAAYFASCELRLQLALTVSDSVWQANPKLIQSDFHSAMAASVALLFVAATGGLWTALLFRQIAAAFWITALAPAGLLLMIGLVMSKLFSSASDVAVYGVLYGVAAIYSVYGFWLAHRLFNRAQDAGWTGGVISFSRWRYFESGSKSVASTRHRQPVMALIKKEFQLQSISWFCAAALLALHLMVVLMRYFHGSFERDSLAGMASEFFWAVWLILPLIISSTAVAEERRLGVTEVQFCLPASRWRQFALKFFLTIVAGVLLGGFMPWLVEGIAAAVGAANPDFAFAIQTSNSDYVSPGVVIGLALGMSLAGFYASTLTRSFLQAMGVAVVAIIGFCLFTSFAHYVHGFLGITLNPSLTIFLVILTTLMTIPCLTYSNYKYIEESGRTWRRNVFGLAGAAIFIFVASAAIYNRAWEVFEPAEPAHGPAKLSLANPPTLHNTGFNSLQVRLPDGRIWFDNMEFSEPNRLKRLWKALVSPFPISNGPQQFMAGSNWTSAMTVRIRVSVPGSYLGGDYVSHDADTIGVRNDGTLWLSLPNQGKWSGNDLTRFGDGTNWQQVVRSFAGILLLKQDGTLWRCGTNQFDWSSWPQNGSTLRTENLYQIGTDSDWKELTPDWNPLVRKSDGSVWSIKYNLKSHDVGWLRQTNLDQVSFQTLSVANEDMAYVRPDGTLWIRWQRQQNGATVDNEFEQMGTNTNWIVVALNWGNLVALKSDGSLWQKWDDRHPNFFERNQKPPAWRLGIHTDWVAITTIWGATIALAADGSMWLWPNPSSYYGQSTLLRLPKQPRLLGNVLSGTER